MHATRNHACGSGQGLGPRPPLGLCVEAAAEVALRGDETVSVAGFCTRAGLLPWLLMLEARARLRMSHARWGSVRKVVWAAVVLITSLHQGQKGNTIGLTSKPLDEQRGYLTVNAQVTRVFMIYHNFNGSAPFLVLLQV